MRLLASPILEMPMIVNALATSRNAAASPPLILERHDGAAPLHLQLGERRLRDHRRGRIERAHNRGMMAEEVSDLVRALHLCGRRERAGSPAT